jgi:hypothetical protein
MMVGTLRSEELETVYPGKQWAWKSLEPVEDEYDYTMIDALIDGCRRPLRVSFDAAVARMTPKFKARFQFYPTFYEQGEKLGSLKMVEILWTNK